MPGIYIKVIDQEVNKPVKTMFNQQDEEKKGKSKRNKKKKGKKASDAEDGYQDQPSADSENQSPSKPVDVPNAVEKSITEQEPQGILTVTIPLNLVPAHQRKECLDLTLANVLCPALIWKD